MRRTDCRPSIGFLGRVTQDLLQSGQSAAVRSAGYEQPNRLSFESMDIWHTRRRKDELRSDGWLGRFLDRKSTKAGGDVSALLLDAGRVKDLTQTMPQHHSISGTPNYMAPEQATGSDELDHRADIYGLGGVAYYLLTGQPPFQASSALAAVVAHTSWPVLPPTELRSDIPARLEQVIMKCLAKKPEQRFSDAQHLKAALIDCLKEEELRKAVRQQAGSSGSQATSAAPAANALVEWIASKS